MSKVAYLHIKCLLKNKKIFNLTNGLNYREYYKLKPIIECNCYYIYSCMAFKKLRT